MTIFGIIIIIIKEQAIFFDVEKNKLVIDAISLHKLLIYNA